MTRARGPQKPSEVPLTGVADLRDLEAEQRLIGRALYRNDLSQFDALSAQVQPSDFWMPEFGELWALLGRRRASGQSLDLLSVKGELETRHPRILESCGGVAGLMKLVDDLVPGMRWHEYAARVVDLARRRRLVAAGETIAAIGLESGTLTDLAGKAAAALHEADVVPPSDALSLADALVDRFAAGHQVARWRTGIAALDDVFLGGVPAGYHVLAARTSAGKSSLMLTLLHQMALCDGARAVVASVEMDVTTLSVRIAALRHGVNAFRLMALQPEQAGERDVEVLAETSEALRQARVAVETRRLRMADIYWRVHHARREWGGVDVVFIDYIQRMTPEDRRAPRYQQIGDLSAACKRMSEEFGVPVIVLAQLSRQAADEERPQLHHLRESGDIEQDADSVWLLWRDGAEAEINVAKHRNGPLRVVPLDFVPASMTFRERREP